MYIKDVKSWGYSNSVIAKMCKEGIIPLAEKEDKSRRWTIPDAQTRPPFSSWQKYCYLMHCIALAHDEDLDVTKIKWGGIPIDQVREGYKYLIEYSFIRSFDVNDLENIKDTYVTSDGEAAIEAYNKKREEKNKKTANKYKIYGEAEFNVGVAKAKVGAEYEHSTE